MGNLETKADNFKWVDKYELIDTDDNDRLLKLMSRVGETQYIGKQYHCHGTKKIQEIQAAMDKKVLTPCPQLMRLVRVGVKSQHLTCSQSKIFCLVFQKPPKTLKDESIYRKFHNQPFSDEDIICVLESCVRALLYLRQMGQFHGKISSSNLFINQDRSVILGDPWLFSEDNNYNENMHGIAYPSPQKILFKNGYIQEPDTFLSDLFSLGVTLLELYYLEHMDIIYQNGYKRLLETKVIQKLNHINSKPLKKHLRVLLSHQPQKRSQILKDLLLVDSRAEIFISLEKQEFKKEYIKSILVTSQVKTVKISRNDPQHREKTIINKICQSRNPSDFSSDTINDQKQVKQMKFKQYNEVGGDRLSPQLLSPIKAESRGNYILNHSSRGSFTFNKKNDCFEHKEQKSISSISRNQDEDSRDIIQLELFQPYKKHDHNCQKLQPKSRFHQQEAPFIYTQSTPNQPTFVTKAAHFVEQRNDPHKMVFYSKY